VNSKDDATDNQKTVSIKDLRNTSETPDEGKTTPSQPERDPSRVYCESCGADASPDCFWLPMPGGGPGQIVFLKIIPMICSFCGDKVLASVQMAPASQLVQASQLPTRAMRRHPEVFHAR
jgi:hypothetical protein